MEEMLILPTLSCTHVGLQEAHLNTLINPAGILKTRLGQLSQLSCKEDGTYQKIDGAAHAVVAAVIAHHGAVVKETNEESLHQGDKVLNLRPQRGFLGSAVKQARSQSSEDVALIFSA